MPTFVISPQKCDETHSNKTKVISLIANMIVKDMLNVVYNKKKIHPVIRDC